MDNKQHWIEQKELESAYRAIFFNGEKKLHNAGIKALSDLSNKCFGTQSTFSSDAMQMARNEGRREVLLYILAYLKITIENLYDIENEGDY